MLKWALGEDQYLALNLSPAPGYASLRHVIELRPDIVKIDRSLIHAVADDFARQVAVSAFVSVARDLEATVVAEGVELAADRHAVRELGVQAAGLPARSPEHRSRRRFGLDRAAGSRSTLSRWPI